MYKGSLWRTGLFEQQIVPSNSKDWQNIEKNENKTNTLHIQYIYTVWPQCAQYKHEQYNVSKVCFFLFTRLEIGDKTLEKLKMCEKYAPSVHSCS